MRICSSSELKLPSCCSLCTSLYSCGVLLFKLLIVSSIYLSRLSPLIDCDSSSGLGNDVRNESKDWMREISSADSCSWFIKSFCCRSSSFLRFVNTESLVNVLLIHWSILAKVLSKFLARCSRSVYSALIRV